VQRKSQIPAYRRTNCPRRRFEHRIENAETSVTPIESHVLQFSGAFDLKHNRLAKSQTPEHRPQLLDRINWGLVQGMDDVTCAEA
jgi:hypothetical protein